LEEAAFEGKIMAPFCVFTFYIKFYGVS